MGLSHSPKIVTNGLVMCLDAGNTKSYSGSGTTWTDLTGRGNNGTLVNGVSYSNSYLTLDGTDDYVDLQNKTDLTLITFSYSCWFYPTSFNASGVDCIFSRENARHYLGFDDNGQYRTFLRGNLYSTTSAQIEAYLGPTGIVVPNRWHNVMMTLDWPSSTFKVYNNGEHIWTLTDASLGTTFINTSVSDSVIGSRYQGVTANRMIGNISYFTYYNRVLSATEIQQNFNALRGRYGI